MLLGTVSSHCSPTSSGRLHGYFCMPHPGFPLSADIEIQGLFKEFQGPSNFIFKDQFSVDVYSMSSRTTIFNVYLCDDDTVNAVIR